MKKDFATLAQAWDHHAIKHVRSDASAAQIARQRRDWYHARLLELKAGPQTAENVALLQEAIGFGRAIGTAAEVAA